MTGNDSKPLATTQQQAEMAERYSEPLAKVFGGMLYKAMTRAYNGPWDGKDLYWAWQRLHDELEELSNAIGNNAPYEEVQHEVADCCNFLAILLDLYRQEQPQDHHEGTP